MSLTLKTGGRYIVINSAGIFSSMLIVQGGAPMASIASQQVLQALAEAVQTVVANSLPLVAAARQCAADFCPFCEIYHDGLCRVGGVV